MVIVEVIRKSTEGNNWIVVVKDMDSALSIATALHVLIDNATVNVREFKSLAEVIEYTKDHVSN